MVKRRPTMLVDISQMRTIDRLIPESRHINRRNPAATGCHGGARLLLGIAIRDAAACHSLMKGRIEAMAKQNCWEFKKCGREPRGAKTAEFGVCPASTEQKLDGVHGGKNGGRACWALTGTFCGGKVQGTFAAKLRNCMDCEFYKAVGTEEGSEYEGAKAILARLH